MRHTHKWEKKITEALEKRLKDSFDISALREASVILSMNITRDRQKKKYQAIVCSLIYISRCRSYDICYAVLHAARAMKKP